MRPAEYIKTYRQSSNFAIDYYLPEPRQKEVHTIFVEVPPSLAWIAARHFDMASIPWVRLLFDVRTMIDRLLGKDPHPKDRRLGVDQVVASGTGFMVLEEEPEREVVVGSIGKFWYPSITFADVPPAGFRNFKEPGWGKLAWAIQVEPRRGGSLIRVEVRLTATDEKSWRRFRRYYRVIGPFSRLIRRAVLKQIQGKLNRG